VLSFAAIYALLYIALSLPPVQNYIKDVACRELNAMTGGTFAVEYVSISPFNKVILEGVSLRDPEGKPVAQIDKLGAGIAIWRLITERKIIITFGEIVGLDAHIVQSYKGGPTNIQFLIDAFSPKDKNKPPTRFNLQINNIVLRGCKISFDRTWCPRIKDSSKIDFNHLYITDIATDLRIPLLRNNDFIIDLRRLSLKEQSGLELERLSGRFIINDHELGTQNLCLKLPGTIITPADITIRIDGLANAKRNLLSAPINLCLSGAEITPSDFASFIPVLANYRHKILLDADIMYSHDAVTVNDFKIDTSDGLALKIKGNASGWQAGLDDIMVEISELYLHAHGEAIASAISDFFPVKPSVAALIRRIGMISLKASGSGSYDRYDARMQVESSLGLATVTGTATRRHKSWHLAGNITTPGFNVGKLIDNARLGKVAINASGKITTGGEIPDGEIRIDAPLIEFQGYDYRGLTANIQKTGTEITGDMAMADDNVDFDIHGRIDIMRKLPLLNVTGSVRAMRLSPLHLTSELSDIEASGDFDIQMQGDNLDNLDGYATFNNLHFSNNKFPNIELENITLECNHSQLPYTLSLESDFITASVQGDFNIAALPASLRSLASHFLPSLTGEAPSVIHTQDYKWNILINHKSPLLTMFKLPITLLEDFEISGACNTAAGTASLIMDVPYLQQGKDKLIRDTQLQVDVDTVRNICSLLLATRIPGKKGDIGLRLNASALSDSLHTDISWVFDRPRAYRGLVSLTTLFSPATQSGRSVRMMVNPSSFEVNDTVWNIDRAQMIWQDQRLNIDSICVHRPGQMALIDGAASASASDSLFVSLRNIDLDYVFETLNINYVTFGGRASGSVQASALLSREPVLFTDNLIVSGLSYNNSLLGDAIIRSYFDTDAGAVHISADVAEQMRPVARIDGDIFVKRDSLSIDIDANKVNVGFLQPFMSAFSSEVEGRATGHVKLYGTFKDIDLTGKVFADPLRMKVDVTNTYYTASDTVVIDPGIIHLKNITLYDRDGHTALLNGEVRHNYFHDPTFDFAITKAQDFLCYDTNSSDNPVWWGTIYGNGSGSLHGVPGYISVVVDMSSAPGSTFTFVLDDHEEAADYEFITFSDRRKEAEELRIRQQLARENDEPEFLRLFRHRIEQEQHNSPTRYDMDLRMRATNDAKINIIMDPVAGDRITATGAGALRMTYNSDDELNLYGTYTLTQGLYNFTLQDLIVRDFKIREGSKITFNGDPLQAMLSLTAAYRVNTSLTELDKSFATDRELNRTNVPVEALLKVEGEMQRPEITFDLDFPTLSSDVAGKVKSIVSTSDMMNRQIIYLLALNRFYTPDYMNTDGNNNELASVASSTLSTQLGQMLGQLAPGWSFSPYFRTEKGDFSDMEVDLALSSALFNNRLLLNGNFGYRDRATSNTTFVGDFDIEYILNTSGTIRLKAYNHFNDQNYYLRQAQTTQGIGIIYKRDFNRFLPGLFRRKKAKTKSPGSTQVTSQ